MRLTRRCRGNRVTEPSAKQEIERKFLIDLTALPFELDAKRATQITQGYLATSASPAREVRLRNRDGHYTLTVKTGSGEVRGEGEVSLSEEQFRALWPFTEEQRVEKTRYAITLGASTAEIDVYCGRHAGLAVVEVEFSDETAAGTFVAPDWFGEEVTGNTAYGNQQLALTGRWPEQA